MREQDNNWPHAREEKETETWGQRKGVLLTKASTRHRSVSTKSGHEREACPAQRP